MRVQNFILGVLVCLSGCGRPMMIAPEFAQRRYVNFVPGPLQPNNCGTPDHYKNCPPSGLRRVALARVKTFVTIEEIGGTPARASNDLPPGE